MAMVSAKKDPNRVRGSGAERRKENKATGKPVSLKKLKSRGADGKKKKRKKKSSKGEEKAPARDFSLIAKIVRRLCAVLFCLLVLSRGTFAEAFGHGTGINKVALSPIQISAYSAINAEFIQADRQHTNKAKLLFQNLMIPSEAVRPKLSSRWARKMPPFSLMKAPESKKKFGGQGPSDPLSDKARAALQTVMADSGMPKLVMYQNKDMLIAGGAACLLGALVSPLFVQADMISLFGMALFYAGTNQCGGRILPLFYWAAGLLALGSVASQWEEGPAPPPRRRRRRVAVESSSSEDSDGDDSGEDSDDDDGAKEDSAEGDDGGVKEE